MSTTTDTNANASDATLGANDAGASGSTMTFDELMARYKGQTAKVNSLTDEKKAIDSRNADLALTNEKLQREAQTATAALRADLEKAKTEQASAQSKYEAAQRVIEQAELAAAMGVLVAEKYPALLVDHLKGYLKSRTDFKDDAAFQVYLDYQNGRAAPVSAAAPTQTQQQTTGEQASAGQAASTLGTIHRSFLAGATPAGGASVRVADDKTRNSAAIADRLMALNPNNPAHKEEYARLEAELSKAI